MSVRLIGRTLQSVRFLNSCNFNLFLISYKRKNLLARVFKSRIQNLADKRGKMKFLSNVFLFWLNARNKYEVLRNNEDKRDTSVNLDVWSLISLAYGTVIVVLSVWGAFACLEIMQNASSGGAVTDISYFIALVGVILCAILALVGVTSGLLNSLQYWIYQRK